MMMMRWLLCSLLASAIRDDSDNVDIDINKLSPAEGITMTIAGLKTDYALFSTGAKDRIAHNLVQVDQGGDDLIIFLEENSHNTPELSVWGHLQTAIPALSSDYAEASTAPWVEMGTTKRYYALNIFSKKSRPDLQVSSELRGCCYAGEQSSKGVALRTIKVGDDNAPGAGMFLILGVGLSPKDAVKPQQVAAIAQEVEGYEATASAEGRKLQVVLVGDINDRVVLPADDADVTGVVMEDHKKKTKTVQAAKIDNDNTLKLLHLMTTPEGRKKLLSWESKTFEGKAIGGIDKQPTDAQKQLCGMFTFMTQWWRDTGAIPAMLTYKRTPWHQQLAETPMTGEEPSFAAAQESLAQIVMPAAQELADGAKGTTSKVILTDDEFLELFQSVAKQETWQVEGSDYEKTVTKFIEFAQITKSLINKDWLVDAPSYEAWERAVNAAEIDDQTYKHRTMLFAMQQWLMGMRDGIPKTDDKVLGAQTYLNLDQNGNPVYLQVGWLDAVGIGKNGFATAAFQSFHTDAVIYGFDHAMTRARLSFGV